MYESPIELIVQQAQNAFEMDVLNNTVNICQKYSINVHPEELKKALAYDRSQYEKGYEDAKKTFYKEGEWSEPFWDVYTRCSLCDEISVAYSDYCPHCGARMKRKEG